MSMMHPSTNFLLLCSVLMTILILQSSSAASENASVYDEPQEPAFSYDEGSENGPSNWGNLNVDWAACRDGKQQTPIDVNDKNVRLDLTSGSLTVKPCASRAIARNRGHDTQVQWPNGAGITTIGGKNFVLQSLHWHFPAEHTFNGIRFPLEMHMVHTSSENKVAVIGIVFRTGLPDSFLSAKLMRQLFQLTNIKSEVNVGITAPPVIKSGTPYYKYPGSLTTPPCTEGVTWILIQEIRTVSQEQLNLLKSLVEFDDTARPIQPLNGRTVSLYKEVL